MSDARERDELAVSSQSLESDAAALPPWELIDHGRYMPRRIRGSFPGRELG